jgi:hypothetical protein
MKKKRKNQISKKKFIKNCENQIFTNIYYNYLNCKIIGFKEASNVEIKAFVLSTSPPSSTLQYLSQTLSVNSNTVSF